MKFVIVCKICGKELDVMSLFNNLEFEIGSEDGILVNVGHDNDIVEIHCSCGNALIEEDYE